MIRAYCNTDNLVYQFVPRCNSLPLGLCCGGTWQGNTVVAELGERDHLWTFMAEMDRPLDADDELSFVVRDMNYFVSQGGIIDNSTLRKLRRPER